jgi:hypothetical protein
MPIKKLSGRQELITAYVDIGFADLVNGVAQAAIELPVNAVVVSGDAVATEAFNSVTSDVLDIGDDTVQNRYLNDANIHALGRTPLIPTGFVTTATQRNINVTWVAVGAAPTAGKVTVSVQYYVRGRAAFAQG